MSKLNDKEIDYIVSTYKSVKSIQKTSIITGFCKNSVNRYVSDISKKDKRSRYCRNEVRQINLKTGETIKVWFKPSHASKFLKISSSEIIRVLNGQLKQAGGFGWKYNKTK